jgi:ABC-type spermidine/putrescine transport system permease subunit I
MNTDNRLTGSGTKRTFFVLAVLLLSVCSLLPLIFTAFISTRGTYRAIPEVFGHTDKGLAYYRELMSSDLMPLLRNTAVLTLCPAAVTAAAAFFLIPAITHLPNKSCRMLALMLLAVPALIPKNILTDLFMQLFSYDGQVTRLLVSLDMLEGRRDLLASKEHYIWIYTAYETLRVLFYPVLAGALTSEGKGSGCVSLAAKISLAYILVRFSMAFVMDYGSWGSLQRPSTYEISDTFSSLAYRRSLIENAYGKGAVLEVTRFIFQLVMNTGIFFALRALVRSNDKPVRDYGRPERSFRLRRSPQLNRNAASLLALAVFLTFASGALFVTAALLFPGLVFRDAVLSFEAVHKIRHLGRFFLNSFFYSAARAALLAFLSFLIAYPLAARSKSIRGLVLVALSAGGLYTVNFLILRSLGLDNTRLGIVFFGSFSCLGAVVLSFSLRRQFSGMPLFRDYLRTVRKQVLILFLFTFAILWCSNAAAYALLTDRSLFPVSFLLHELTVFPNEVEGAEVSGIRLFASLPSLLAVWSALLLIRTSGLSCLTQAIKPDKKPRNG